MKKALIVSLGTTILLILISFSFSFGYYYVCIDPGHGGSDSATVGPVYGVREKNANLTVALALKSKIEYYIYPVYMTRTIDTTITLYDRARMANTANGGGPVNYFISVHHNSSADTSVNGTEAYYCNAEYTDSEFGYQWRGLDLMYGARDSTFAKKVRLALRDSLQHRYRCSRQSLCGDTTKPCCMKCWYVLKNTIMQSTLSEASFITNPWVEYQFYYNTNYIDKEAGAICTGWWSTYLQGGLGIVRNAYSTASGSGNGGVVGVAPFPWDPETVPSPYEACWLVGSVHNLQAITPQQFGDYWYTFHHWAHLWEGEPDQTWYNPLWTIMVPAEFDYHNYVAYLTGGPYSVDVVWPYNGCSWEVGKTETIGWNVSVGTDSSSLIDIFLSRNGGSTWETIATNVSYDTLFYYGAGRYYWVVNGLASPNCKVRVKAHDLAGNIVEDTSGTFSITYRVAVNYPKSGEVWEVGNRYNIKWSASPGQNNSTLIDIKLSRNGGTSWETIADNLPNTGLYSWAVGGNLSTNCLIKVRAHDSAGNSAEAISGAFAITYKVTLISPEHLMCVGWGWIIRCEVSPGQNTTTVIDFYLSRDGGATWPEYLGSRPYSHTPWGDDTLTWRVTPPHTQQAKLKLYAHDNFGHSATYITPYEFTVCGGCVRGDIRKDGIYYIVSDAVAFARWWVNLEPPSLCDPDTVYHISPCDVNCDGKVGLSDLVYLVRIMCYDFSPCDAGPPYSSGSPPYAGEIEVKAKENTISVSSDYPLGAMSFDFNTDGAAANPVLIVPNMQLKTSAQNGKLRVLVWNENGESIPPGTQDIFTISGNAELVSVGAAGYDSKELKANITDETTPSRYALSQNYPNPFNPQTQIKFSLAEASQVSLVIYNLLGQKVVTLLDKTLPPGKHVIDWNGEDESGQKVASGIYFYHLQAGEYDEVRKMVLVK